MPGEAIAGLVSGVSSRPHLEVPAGVRSVLTPPEDLLPHRWVEKYRRLHEKDAAESGAFSYDKIPYMVEPTDAVADASVRSITLIKASRCSGTELINNVAAWSIDCRPMPAIYVLPRADDVEEEFKGRLRRIVEASPQLAAHVAGGNWATEEAISLDSMTIMSAACTRAGDFIRRTSGLNLFDEVDNCSEEAMKSRLGDVWSLLEERITTFGHRAEQLGVSTPTTTEASGWKAWEASDRRKYWCPCPRCGDVPGAAVRAGQAARRPRERARPRADHPRATSRGTCARTRRAARRCRSLRSCG